MANEKLNENLNPEDISGVVADPQVSLLEKSIWAVTADDTKSMDAVNVLLRHRSYGNGNNKSDSYSLILLFKKGLFEVEKRLTQDEYVNIALSRNVGASIPETLTLKMPYRCIYAKKMCKDGIVRDWATLQVICCNKVRFSQRLSDVQLDNAKKLNAIKFIERPELTDDTSDEYIMSIYGL